MDISHQIKDLFSQLDDNQKKGLLQELKLSSVEQAPEREVSTCPHCDSPKIIRHSKYKGKPRYKCKSCGRTFLPSTGTHMHNIKKKDKYNEYARIIKDEGLHTIAYMAKRMKISINTSFEWRHKLLLSIPKKKGKFEGEVQADDLWFDYSQKGRKGLKYSKKRGGGHRRGDNNYQAKLIAASDKEGVIMQMARIGRLSKVDLDRVLGDKFKRHGKLISDGHRSFSAFAKGAKLEHVKFLAAKHKAKTGENVQYINSLASHLVDLVNHRLRGVATKYLQQYASYFSYCQHNKFDATAKSFNENTKVWDAFTNMEKYYEQFIKTKSVRTYRCPVAKKWKSQNWNQGVIHTVDFI